MFDEKNGTTTHWNAKEVRDQSRGVEKSRKKKRKFNFGLYIGCVVIVSALLAGIGWLLANDLCSLNKDYVEVKVTVEEDESFGDVVSELKHEGLINYKWFFKLYATISGDKKMVDSGSYELNSNMDYRCLLRRMHDYEADLMSNEGLTRVTIPEGYNVQQIIDLLVEKEVASREDLEDACANFEFEDYTFLEDDMKGKVERMEGFLFPDTYYFDPNKTAVYAIDTMLTAFTIQFDDEMNAAIAESPYSMYELITIASLIEKETDGTDQAKIASVIYNRLNNGGETNHLLQVDASLQYALGREVTEKDYETLDSDYNLYQHEGLPPTPIANPGLESIKAALFPEDTDYYYYVLDPAEGHHVFAKTLAEHNQNIAKIG